TEILQEFDGLRLRPPLAAELETAKRSCRFGGALELETNGDIAAALTGIVGLDLPVSELADRFARLEHVALGDIEAVAKEQLTSQRTVVVIVGPGAKLQPQLHEKGLTVIDATPAR